MRTAGSATFGFRCTGYRISACVAYFFANSFAPEDVLQRLSEALAPVGGDQDQPAVQIHIRQGATLEIVRQRHDGVQRVDDRIAGHHDPLVGHALTPQVVPRPVVAAKCRSATTPATRRLISSGNGRHLSPVRSPAST